MLTECNSHSLKEVKQDKLVSRCISYTWHVDSCAHPIFSRRFATMEYVLPTRSSRAT